MDPLQGLTLTGEVVRLIGGLDELKGRWQALGRLAPERLDALRRVATIESVGSSTRIEGAHLSDGEVDRLLSGLHWESFRSRDEEEVAGYAEAMELVFESYEAISLTVNHIKQLHGVLLAHSHKDQRHRGEYKTAANHVEAFGPDGASLGVIFATASPFDTPRLMEELVTWADAALAEGRHHPLLVVAAFVVRFLAIHPFQDGNGRLSRILTTLLLLRCGYLYVPFSSLERVVEENKQEYYRALRAAQSTVDEGEARLGEWVLFFLRGLTAQKERLERKIAEERVLSPLPPLAEQLLAVARDHGRLTMAAAVELTGANRNTLKVHLRRLVASGRLLHHGRGKGSWYSVG